MYIGDTKVKDPVVACLLCVQVSDPRALPALLTPYVSWRSGSHSTGGARWRPRAPPSPVGSCCNVATLI